MAPLLNTLISRIVLGQTKKSRPDLPRPASITFSEGDFPGGHQQYGGYTSQPSSIANSPTRAIPHQAAPFSPAQDILVQPSSLSRSPRQEHTQALPGRTSLSHTESVQAPAKHSRLAELAAQTHAGDSDPLQHSQQQPAVANALLNRQPEEQGSAVSIPASRVSDADQGSQAKHGYNGDTDSSDAAAAATSGTSDARTSASNDAHAELEHSNVNSTDTERATDQADSGSAAIEGSAKQQESFAELVQGTEQLLGLLASRNIS